MSFPRFQRCICSFLISFTQMAAENAEKQLSILQTNKRRSAISEFQQRLVLLHHSLSCPSSNSLPPRPCRSFSHCFNMASLLQHLQTCDDRQCPRKHCQSTRFLLLHRQGCTSSHLLDPPPRHLLDTSSETVSVCEVCRPLNVVLERKRKRERDVRDLAERDRETQRQRQRWRSERDKDTDRERDSVYSVSEGTGLSAPPSPSSASVSVSVSPSLSSAQRDEDEEDFWFSLSVLGDDFEQF